MQLQAYFDRIGYRGSVAPDFATLRDLLSSHICAVPFENLDVQLGCPLATAPENAYAKIVEGRRGGWCYEQNGLFGWALEEIGFNVTRIAAAVLRHERGDASNANHLCLLVRCGESPQIWLADVGFGGGMIRPIELAEGNHTQAPFRLGLRQLEDGSWRFWENLGDGEFSYDFAAQPGDETALSNKCKDLQTNPESGFVLNLVVQKRTPNQHLSLRGRVLQFGTANGIETEVLTSARELQATLTDIFDLDVPEATGLWPRILSRHEALFGETP
jgi:N-hydroxyarylamine O-acetyltransferase